MKHLILSILILSFMLTSCSTSKRIEEDLKLICNEFDQLVDRNDLAKNEKFLEFSDKVPTEKLSLTTQKFLNDMYSKSNVSYEDFEEFAKENSIESWECESLKRLFEQQ